MIDIDGPKAKKNPHKLVIHNDVRMDDYYWLNDRENPEVIAYLEQENEYYHTLTAHTKDFQKIPFPGNEVEDQRGRFLGPL